MENRISYQGVNDALAQASAEMGAAECHGMCCGVLCASGQLNIEAMVARLAGGGDGEKASAGGAADQLRTLLTDTTAQLNGGEFDLQLLLPDDEVVLAERSVALGLWCQGFVMGLSAGGVTEDTQLPQDSRELLLDFTRIAHSLHEREDLEQDDDDEDEAAYVEVQEYIRLGVLLILEELKSIRPEGQIH